MIPNRLKKVLLTTGAFKELKNLIESGAKDFPKNIFPDIAKTITTELKERIDDGEFSNLLLQPSIKQGTIVNYKTLKTHWFKTNPAGVKSLVSGEPSKILKVLLMYANIPDQNWGWHLDSTGELNNESKLLTSWYLYRYDYSTGSSAIKRTMITLSARNGPGMDVKYRSLKGELLEGDARLKGKILTITITEGEKSIEINSIVENYVYDKNRSFLNVIIRSSRNAPYAKVGIMQWAGFKDIRQDRVVTVCHTSEKANRKNCEGSGDTNPIVEFLAANNFQLVAESFPNGDLTDLTDRNASIFKQENPGYKDLSGKLGTGPWFSVNERRSLGEIIVFKWTFTFNEIQKKVTFLCERPNGEPFYGVVELFHEHMVFKMERKQLDTPQNDNKVLFYGIAKKDRHSKHIYLSGTGYLNQDNYFDIKTILFKMDEYQPIIPYEAFLKSRILDNLEKRRLLSGANWSWPEITQGQSDLDKGSRLFTSYLAFCPNFYGHEHALQQITLHIDDLGFVNERIKYIRDGEEFFFDYAGKCSFLADNKNLRLSNVTANGFMHSTYIFGYEESIFPGKNILLKGIVIDTDHDHSVCADACIAIRWDALQKYSDCFKDFQPEVLNPDDDTYEALAQFLKNKGVDLKKHYFEQYRSIRS